LEGSVRKAGNLVRITAQLIEAATGNHIWAERYDRDLTDIFDLQDELQEAIVSAVEPELAGAEMARAVNKAPENLDAWELYQKAVWHFNQRTAADRDLAEPMFERAVALDPSFARAYAMHAWLLHNAIVYGYRTDRDAQLGKGVELARTGVLKDDRDALTHFALGRVLAINVKIAGAIRELRLAVQLNPNFAFAAWGLGEALGRAGQFEESVEMLDVALRLSPRDTLRFLFFAFKGRSHAGLSQNEAAEAAYREAAATNRNVAIIMPHLVLVDFLVRQDRLEDARAVMAELLQSRPGLTLAEAGLAIEGGQGFFAASGWRNNFIAAGLPE
jgi:tetratricopeptide (TPR) repeat protein